MLTSEDRAGIRARVENCRTYNFGMRDADCLAHEDVPALLLALEAADAEVKRLQFATTAVSPSVDDLAQAYDRDAFEIHPAEARSHLAAIQWSARRKMATDAAVRVTPWIGAHVVGQLAHVRTQRDELFELSNKHLARAEAAETKITSVWDVLAKPFFLRTQHNGYTTEDFSRPIVEANKISAALTPQPETTTTTALAEGETMNRGGE